MGLAFGFEEKDLGLRRSAVRFEWKPATHRESVGK
jgi:hypothetical protein